MSRAFPPGRPRRSTRRVNEPAMSEETEAVLWRVGRALGKREGTSWRDDAQLRRVAGLGHAEGVVEGHAEGVVEGRAEGVVEGRARGLAEAAVSILRERGVEVAMDPVIDAVRRVSPGVAVKAAQHAGSEGDFLARLGRVRAGEGQE